MSVFTKERFYCWLAKSIDLFQPQNSEYYVDFDETGEPVFKEPNDIRPPKHLPQHLRNVQDISSETCDRLFHTTIDLVHPDFDEELPKLSQMDFNDSARMLFYIHRANLKFGQKFFYRVWHDGTILKALRRLAQTAEDHIFPKEPLPFEHIRGFFLEHPHYCTKIFMQMGDICDMQADAIVNPTDTMLSAGGGVDRAIRDRAGELLQDYCDQIHKPLAVGSTFMTDGYDLAAKHIFHTVLPKKTTDFYGMQICVCYTECMNLAKDRGIKTLAFPAMGTGAVGLDMESAAEFAVGCVFDWMQLNTSQLESVTFVFTSQEKKKAYEKALCKCIVKTMLRLFTPQNLALVFRKTLPMIIKAHREEISPMEKSYSDHYKQVYFYMHMAYYEYVQTLYRLIGDPDIFEVMTKTFGPKAQAYEEKAMQQLDQLDFVQCVACLLWQQRLDYASGGRTCDHMRFCANGNASRVLEHMLQLL